MTWYTGEGGAIRRATAVAQVDQSLSLAYGMRANEEGMRIAVQNIAVFAAPRSRRPTRMPKCNINEMKERVGNALAPQNGQQKIEDIAASELAFAQTTMQNSKERQQERKLTLENLLQEVEEAPETEVAAQILSLQTRLQASLQTTAMLYQMNIVNYL